ncbi:lipoprotein-releasing ABC transporter permease subunit [Aliagarivorans marinus]|uniref:lipoprotein-releasing ABC transporter permease subunit n=1 Tax=Aliagarivorans marinus TaxID=561965 RepID=UPI000422DE60|nr:lipoprotein-releasing ABC transporter permease subunit [Aliagarivorans marinus]
MSSHFWLHRFIAWRFSRGAKQQRFASFVSWFSTLGITLGVAALITVISVMNGFEAQLKQRILNLVPHLSVPAEQAVPEALQPLPSSPLILSEVVLQSSKGLQAGLAQGIDPAEQADAKALDKAMLVGRLGQLQAGKYQIVLGINVANTLGVHVGDTVRVMATERLVYTPLGEMPAQRNFTVAGIFQFGAEVDSQYALVHIDDLARLQRSRRADLEQTRFFLNDPFDIDVFSPVLNAAGVEFSDWRSYYGELFQAVRMEKNMMGLLFCLIIAVAAFNILSSLVMMVGDKQGDVAILQTLGLERRRVVHIFVLQGAWSGCIGALVGALLGFLLATYINPLMSLIGLNFIANLGGSGLPVLFKTEQILIVTIGAMLLSVVATIYPAWRASQILPAEVLRHE